MFDFIAPFLFGLVGSTHCLGMCGPLVLAYSLHLRPPGGPRVSAAWPASISHHLAFHAGRLITYSLLGAFAAAVLQAQSLHRVFAGLRSGVTLGGGILMIAFGLGLAGILPLRFFFVPAWRPGTVGRTLFQRLLSSNGLPSKLILGFLSGFLPCMLSFIMIVKAAATANPLLGFFTMLLFGLGTLPALFLTGISASLLSMKARLLGERAAGVMAAVMGVILIVKAGRYFLR